VVKVTRARIARHPVPRYVDARRVSC
jgi:hypothetical protein